jgi:hypothetical protein
MGKAGLLFLVLGMGATVSQGAETPSAAQPISVVIRTDHEKYSLADTVKLDVSLQNTSDATVYVDRRIFCCGIGRRLAHPLGLPYRPPTEAAPSFPVLERVGDRDSRPLEILTFSFPRICPQLQRVRWCSLSGKMTAPP